MLSFIRPTSTSPPLDEMSGANYLCRVFKKETGQSPAQWRALTGRAAQAGLTPEETMREQEMYI